MHFQVSNENQTRAMNFTIFLNTPTMLYVKCSDCTNWVLMHPSLSSVIYEFHCCHCCDTENPMEMDISDDDLLFYSIFNIEYDEGLLYSTEPYHLIDDNSNIVSIPDSDKGWLYGICQLNPLPFHGVSISWQQVELSVHIKPLSLKNGTCMGVIDDETFDCTYNDFLQYSQENGLCYFQAFTHIDPPQLTNKELNLQVQLNSLHSYKNTHYIYAPKGTWKDFDSKYNHLLIIQSGTLVVVKDTNEGFMTYHMQQNQCIFIPSGYRYCYLSTTDSVFLNYYFIHFEYPKNYQLEGHLYFDQYEKVLWQILFNVSTYKSHYPEWHMEGVKFAIEYKWKQLYTDYKIMKDNLYRKPIKIQKIVRPCAFLRDLAAAFNFECDYTDLVDEMDEILFKKKGGNVIAKKIEYVDAFEEELEMERNQDVESDAESENEVDEDALDEQASEYDEIHQKSAMIHSTDDDEEYFEVDQNEIEEIKVEKKDRFADDDEFIPHKSTTRKSTKTKSTTKKSGGRQKKPLINIDKLKEINSRQVRLNNKPVIPMKIDSSILKKPRMKRQSNEILKSINKKFKKLKQY
eukprot:NODE_97_length_20652_cov_0.832093.p4 type:complete len:572 gc:universal NODE_97_length_20652_cov_0.832093:15946-17661(+)